MASSIAGQGKCDCLKVVTAWLDLTVCHLDLYLLVQSVHITTKVSKGSSFS